MWTGTFDPDRRRRTAQALRADGPDHALAALRSRRCLPAAPAVGAAERGVTRDILLAVVLLVLTALLVWFDDKQPKSYWQLHREALEGLDRSRGQPGSDPLTLGRDCALVRQDAPRVDT